MMKNIVKLAILGGVGLLMFLNVNVAFAACVRITNLSSYLLIVKGTAVGIGVEGWQNPRAVIPPNSGATPSCFGFSRDRQWLEIAGNLIGVAGVPSTFTLRVDNATGKGISDWSGGNFVTNMYVFFGINLGGDSNHTVYTGDFTITTAQNITVGLAKLDNSGYTIDVLVENPNASSFPSNYVQSLPGQIVSDCSGDKTSDCTYGQ